MGRKTLCSSKHPWLLFSLLIFLGIVGLHYSKPTVKTLASTKSSSLPNPKTPQVIRQGEEIVINNRKLPVPWMQWQVGENIHTGLSDTGAMLYLGLELLSTKNPRVQPVHWFSSARSQPLNLNAYLLNSYRYLDVTEIIERSDAQLKIAGNLLKISPNLGSINNIRQTSRVWSNRLEITLTKPAFWQVDQDQGEVNLTIAAQAKSEVLNHFSTTSKATEENLTINNHIHQNYGNYGNVLKLAVSPFPRHQLEISPLNPKLPQPVSTIEADGSQTQLKIKVPRGQAAKVWSLPNPHRIFVDFKQDSFVRRQITWEKGLIWHQRLVSLGKNLFPVIWLEADLSSPNLEIKPITSNGSHSLGTKPLMTMGKDLPVLGAINGSFFNRNNQLPLGAIRQDNSWLSGPILNRGAIAWNKKKAQFSRLSLQETLTTSQGKNLPVILLNTGYVKAGIARYTSAWGKQYKTMIDDEIIITVKNQKVVEHLRAGKAGEDSFPIPPNGYLLALRSFDSAAVFFPMGTKLNLSSVTNPAHFADYPNILGAGPMLVQNNRIVLNGEGEKFSYSFNRQGASRSVIGLNRRGKLMFVTVHNRVGGKGPTLLETAKLMQSLGAVQALNLDGGSSTSLYLGGQLIDRPANTAAKINNGIGIFLKEEGD